MNNVTELIMYFEYYTYKYITEQKKWSLSSSEIQSQNETQVVGVA